MSINNKGCYTWYIEPMNTHEGHMMAIHKVVFSGHTKFQYMEIIDTIRYGRCLILDGKIQSAEVDEYIYHEALVHPGMLIHPSPQYVMVIGGGEGATVREILKHPQVKNVIMVDIDEEVVNMCKRYLSSWHMGALDDPKVEIIYMDARKYLENTSKQFDIIIVDITEPISNGPSYLLFTQEFYQIVKDRLTSNGLVVVQSGSAANNDLLCFASIYRTLCTVFPQVHAYHTFIPSFALSWGFTISLVNPDKNTLSHEKISVEIKNRQLTGLLKYYDEETHMSMFSLYKYLREAFEKTGKIIKDSVPLTIN